MLAIAALPYTDVRVEDPSAAGNLDANLGRLPVAEIDGVAVGQSAAINHAVAAACGLLGASPLDAAQIIAVCEHVKELVAAYRGFVPYGTEPTAAGNTAFFEDAALDTSGVAAYETRAARGLRWHLGRLERVLGDGCAVGGRLSLADVVLFSALGDTLAADRTKEPLPAWKREPFGDAARTAATLAAFPRVAKCVAAVAEHEKVKAWLAARPLYGF